MRPAFRWKVGPAEAVVALCAPREPADLACGGCRSFLRFDQTGAQPQFLDRCPGCLAVELDRARARLVEENGPDRRAWPPGAAIASANFLLAAEVIRGETEASDAFLARAVGVLDRAGFHQAADLIRQLVTTRAADLAA